MNTEKSHVFGGLSVTHFLETFERMFRFRDLVKGSIYEHSH